MKKVSAWWVPTAVDVIGRLWANRVDASTSLLHLFNENPSGFISRFWAVDETWIHHFDPVSKVQRKAWKHASSPPPKKFRVVASAGKVMATVFWDADGIVLIDYLEHAVLSQEPTTLIWLEKFGLHWKRRDEESCITECCFSRTVHLLTHHLKHWLPS